MSDSKKTAVVMAAGKGTRMKSELPKVLVEVHERPMIDYVLDALEAGGIGHLIVVVGYLGEEVKRALADRVGVEFAHQTEQLGTGHAVMACRDLLLERSGPVMVVAGDSPMMRPESVSTLLEAQEQHQAACVLGSIQKADPTGLGRIVRDEQGNFEAIVEQRDATEQQRQITEVNMSYYVFDRDDLLETLGQLQPDNSQGEYYITDCPGVMKAAGKEVLALSVLQACEALSVNTLEELNAVEATMTDFYATNLKDR